MSKTIIEPSNEDKRKINAKLEKIIINTCRQTKFINFQEIRFQGTFTLEELKEITKVIETAEAWLVLESKPYCIECGEAIEPIIKQCEKCGGAIRACCPDHEDNC